MIPAPFRKTKCSQHMGWVLGEALPWGYTCCRCTRLPVCLILLPGASRAKHMVKTKGRGPAASGPPGRKGLETPNLREAMLCYFFLSAFPI